MLEVGSDTLQISPLFWITSSWMWLISTSILQALDAISATCLCDVLAKSHVPRWRCATWLAVGSESLAPWTSVATAARRAQRRAGWLMRAMLSDETQELRLGCMLQSLPSVSEIKPEFFIMFF